MRYISKKHLSIVAGLAFWLACPAFPVLATIQQAGDVTATGIGRDIVDFTLSGGGVARVQVIASDILRVRWNPSESLATQISGAIQLSRLDPFETRIYDQTDRIYVMTDRMQVFIFKHPFHLLVLRPDGSLVSADREDGIQRDGNSGTILDRKYAPPSEHYAGLGLRGGPADRRGRRFFMRNTDWGGYTEFSDPLYSSTPFFYGFRNGAAYGLFLDNPAGSFFDIDSSGDGVVSFGALDGELDYYLFAGPKPADVSQAFARLTGFSPLPPLWSLGYHQSRFGYSSQQEFLDVASQFRQLRIPCDALFFDLFYMDKLRPFTWDPANFPTPQDMNQMLSGQGFNTVAIVDPVVLSDDPQWATLASANAFLTSSDDVPLVNNIFYGNVSWLDFTRSTVRDWYDRALKSLLGSGIGAVWNDLNEPAQNVMPNAIYDFDGERRTDTQARNLYALNEVKTSWLAQQEFRPRIRPWVLSRSGYPGIQRYAAGWSGDATSSFDSLRISIEISLSMGLSGQNQFGHDVGGFMGSPSPELFIRWLEFGSLIPYFRNHSWYIYPPREPWAFGEPYTSMARSIIEERYRLLPYLYTLFEAASQNATPVLAPLFFNFPNDENTFSQDTEYMLGPYMLVAPVFEEGATSRKVYLPSAANWIDEYTDAAYNGGSSIITNAELDRTPLFVREGAIIPRGPVRQYAAESPAAPAQVTVDIYLPSSEEFTLYEDDGVTTEYIGGAFMRTRLKNSAAGGQDTFGIERTKGGWSPPPRTWRLQFHRVGSTPAAVRFNGAPLPQASSEDDLAAMTAGWMYQADSTILVVRIPDSAQPLGVSFE